jgi:glycosyltransferase involved in cell wall biosynthesis
MRVLLAITRGEVGGAQEHVRVVMTGLVARGHEVGLMVLSPSPLATAATEAGVRVFPWQSIRRNLNPFLDLRARQELAATIADWAPDVVHLNSSKAGVLGVGLLRPPHGVTIFTCHHAPFGPGRALSHRVVARPVEQFMLPRLNGIISDGVRDVPALERIAPRVPVRLIPNAVPVRGEPASMGPLQPVALWVARLARPKDPFLAVSAWERVIERVPEARMLMCGTGPLEERVRARIDASPARGSIELLGFAPDLRAMRAQSSVFLLATRVEGGLTMATLEAMTNGLVPIVSDAGDAPMLEDLDMGVCVRSRSPEALAAAIVDVFNDPATFARLRENAMRYSREDRTPADLVAETEAFYREVLDRGRARGR